MKQNQSFIFLDRDGVINYDSADYIKSPDEWLPLPGSLSAIARLNRANFRVIVLSNQSGIARGYYTLETLAAIHQKMIDTLAKAYGKIEKIYFCPHSENDNCTCRKPKTGLFEQAAREFNIDLTQTIYIGDKYIDYLAAKNVGCRFMLVKTGYGGNVLANHPELLLDTNIFIAADLSEAVDQLLLKSH